MDCRIAVRGDLPGLLSLYAQLNPEKEPLETEKALAIWDETERAGISRHFVAADGDRIVSSCTVSVIPNLTRGGQPYAVIENVVTDAEQRRKGIGRLVVGEAIAFAREKNCFKVMLLSGCGRTGAHRFYESLGFSGDSKRGFELRFSVTR
jgi:Predicted acetyltransferase